MPEAALSISLNLTSSLTGAICTVKRDYNMRFWKRGKADRGGLGK
jgi:hypothetical protein